MTADLEDRIRTSLRQRAEAIEVEVPEPDLVHPFRRPARPRRLEIAAVAAALLLFVGAGLVVALRGRETPTAPAVGEGPAPATSAVGEGSGSEPTTTIPPASGPLAEILAPGALVAMPPPWQLQRFNFLSAAAEASARVGVLDGTELGVVPPATRVEYVFSDGERSLQLNFYPLGERQPTITTPEPPLVEVRGSTGYYLDYGGDRYRVQWDEGGRTWDVDAHGFADLDEVVAVLDAVQRLGDADWSAAMPPTLADTVRDNPGMVVTWDRAGHTVEVSSQPGWAS